MDNYLDLVMKIDELARENSDLRYQYMKEQQKRRKDKENFYQRSKTNRRIVLTMGAILTATSVAVGAALNSFIVNLNKINTGKKELANRVRSECLYGMSCYDDSVAGLVFNIGNESVSYESAMNAILHRAHTFGMSDLDLYIGISEIFNSNMAKSLVPDVNREDINDRCIEVYLEEELERISNYGK